MRIAVVNETSAGDRNCDIIAALEGTGHSIINAGMKKSGGFPELSYIETGLLAAILINCGCADFVIGGCGTGQGFLNSVMQYPGMFCGLISKPLDAWLFSRINAGNCISLALNKGYGWAGEINLKFIFEKMFDSDWGSGYPAHRKEPQHKSREILASLSKNTHYSFDIIIDRMDKSIIRNVLMFPGIREILDIDSIQNEKLKSSLIDRYRSFGE